MPDIFLIHLSASCIAMTATTPPTSEYKKAVTRPDIRTEITLFKTATALEETGKVKIVALEKTGTITKDKFHVYKDGEVCELNDAYEKGWLTKDHIKQLEARHPDVIE